VECALFAGGGARDTSETSFGDVAIRTLALQGTVSLSSPGLVTLECVNLVGSANTTSAKLSAIQVGGIN
jgi:hypothetical protein